MKFVININQFSPNTKEVDLTEKEVDYIMMLASGVNKDRITEILIINDVEIENLYLKFGLTNTKRIRDNQLATVVASNSLLNAEVLTSVYNKYKLEELKSMIDFIKNLKSC